MSPHPSPIARCPPILCSHPIELLPPPSTAAVCSPLSALLQPAALMTLVLSFAAESRRQRCRCPSSPDYSSLTAAPSPRAASPEYTPVSLRWWPGTPEHGPSTTLRLGLPMLMPLPHLRRAASPDYSPSSSPSRPASPEYTPLGRCGWRAGSPDYTPSTTCRAASPDYEPSTPTYRVASPEYSPVSRLWRAAGSPDHRPSNPPPGAESWDHAPASPPRRAASPDYTPRTPPARAPPYYSPGPAPSLQLVSDAESSTSAARRYRRRLHPYQRRGADTCTWSASGVNHGQRHLVY